MKRPVAEKPLTYPLHKRGEGNGEDGSEDYNLLLKYLK